MVQWTVNQWQLMEFLWVIRRLLNLWTRIIIAYSSVGCSFARNGCRAYSVQSGLSSGCAGLVLFRVWMIIRSLNQMFALLNWFYYHQSVLFLRYSVRMNWWVDNGRVVDNNWSYEVIQAVSKIVKLNVIEGLKRSLVIVVASGFGRK